MGADTLVVLDGAALGKPLDAEDARRMLRLLSGRSHEVVTGVAVVRAADRHVISGVETTTVRFRALDADDIAALVDSGEATDKAGAYGIQGLAALAVDAHRRRLLQRGGAAARAVAPAPARRALGGARRKVVATAFVLTGGVDVFSMEAPIETVRWRDGAVRIIDQRFLPRELVWRDCREVEDLAEAIETLAVRGAPAIGVAAGYGVAAGRACARSERGADPAEAPAPPQSGCAARAPRR